MSYVLKTYGLTKKFGRKKAVSEVSMTIEKGDIYGFIGRNGAGKTTFMRMVLGTAFSSEGTIELFEGENLNQARRKIGALIESPGLYEKCTAYENMKRFSILYGGTEEEIQELLELVGLGSTGKKKVRKFSLGMRQRLGIAIALLGNPEFMVLDEPVNGLDPAGIKEIRDVILRLNKERSVTFLISSHLLDELAKVVTKYGIINEGVLVEEVSAKELEERCHKQIKIKVDDTEKAAALLRGEISPDSMEVSEHTIMISDHLDESARFNRLLVKNDIMVSELAICSYGLEEYFVERIGV